jgi:hypothetical protein
VSLTSECTIDGSRCEQSTDSALNQSSPGISSNGVVKMRQNIGGEVKKKHLNDKMENGDPLGKRSRRAN